jgi:hypothetical protein
MAVMSLSLHLLLARSPSVLDGYGDVICRALMVWGTCSKHGKHITVFAFVMGMNGFF